MGYHIVVGVDGSETAQTALAWAVDEARLRAQGALTAVFAWQFPLIGIPGAFDRDQLEQEAKDFLVREIAAITTYGNVNGDGPPITPIVAQGDPSASLLAACEQRGADLLVLGSRGREGFAGLLLGSVGQECAVHAPCPVVIVKPRPAAIAGVPARAHRRAGEDVPRTA